MLKPILLRLSLFPHDTIVYDVPDLDPPRHGEVGPVEVGGEEDEADPLLWMPVED